jgi:hypothetical protein
MALDRRILRMRYRPPVQRSPTNTSTRRAIMRSTIGPDMAGEDSVDRLRREEKECIVIVLGWDVFVDFGGDSDIDCGL